MKPAHRTVSYVVYSPNYKAGEGKYKEAKNKKHAMRICRQFGIGSEADRIIQKNNANRYQHNHTNQTFTYTG